jgi:peptidoglycan/LPS O-acetylase OafA/YrhL
MSNFSQGFANQNKAILNQRITNLDILRAIAALMVCLVHFLRKPLYEGTIIWDIFQYGKHGVDIFFVISGFVIPLSLGRFDKLQHILHQCIWHASCYVIGNEKLPTKFL